MTRRSAPLPSMRISSLGAVAIIGLLALIGGVAGYQYVAAATTSTGGSAASRSVTTTPKHHAHVVRVVGKPVVHVKVRKCRPGYSRKGQSCVRHVDRTVVVNVPASPAPAPAPVAAPAPGPVAVSVAPGANHSSGARHTASSQRSGNHVRSAGEGGERGTPGGAGAGEVEGPGD